MTVSNDSPENLAQAEKYQFEVFPWNENFATGVALIDEQHQQLVHLINKLASHLSRGSSNIQMAEVFGELVAYADYHFKAEEQIWQPRFDNDPWYTAHKRAHDSFLPKAQEIQNKLQGASYEKVLEETLKFLVNWLVFHILDNDRRMAKTLRALDEGLGLQAAKARADEEMTGIMQTFVETVLNMYENLTSRSLELIREKNERLKTERALVVSQMQKQSMDKLLQSMTKTIEAMASTVEIRAPYTAGHQRRVAQLAEAIAQELGLPEDETQGVYLAATVHDIGDIQIPAEILTRPSSLNSIEREIVQNHPQAGYDILKNIDFPWPIAEMVYQHHERLDGSGYPKGLKGDQILLGAKVIAVADVVEAMSSHRPYRASLGIDAALAELEAHQGRLYEPTIVAACIRLIREKKFTFQA